VLLWVTVTVFAQGTALMPFHPLLRRWLIQTTQQKLRERMSGEAGETDAPPEMCDIAVVFALGIEAGGLVDRTEERIALRGEGFTVRLGTLEGRRLAIVTSGAGARNAARATEAVLRGHKPQWIICAGLAGGLRPQLRRNDIVMANQVGNTEGRQLQIDLTVEPAELAKHPGLHVGRLLSVERPVCNPEEKAALGEAHEALAIDMETLAVAEICRCRRVRCLAVRVVYDPVDDRLPRDVETLLAQPTMATRLGAAAATIFRRPSSLKELYQLRENAMVASERLATFLQGIISQLDTQSADRGSG